MTICPTRTEYQASDQLELLQQFIWTLADQAPDAHTIWDFREALIQAGMFGKLFALVGRSLR